MRDASPVLSAITIAVARSYARRALGRARTLVPARHLGDVSIIIPFIFPKTPSTRQPVAPVASTASNNSSQISRNSPSTRFMCSRTIFAFASRPRRRSAASIAASVRHALVSGAAC